MQEEIWKDVVGFEDYFRISSLGRLFSKRTGKILKQYTFSKTGRKAVATKIGGRKGKNHRFMIHRLVAEAFIPNPDNRPEVNHKDCDPSNNSVENLEWSTRADNLAHWLESEKFKTHDFSREESRIFNYETLVENFKESGLSIRKYAKVLGCSYSGLQQALKYIQTGERYS